MAYRNAADQLDANARYQSKNRQMVNSVKLHYQCQNPTCACKGAELHHCQLTMLQTDTSSGIYYITQSVMRYGRARVIADMRGCVVLCSLCANLVKRGLLDISGLPTCKIGEDGNVLP